MAQAPKASRVLIGVSLIAVVFFVFFSLQGYLYLFSSGKDYQGETTAVVIPQGSSSAAIARILAREGVVRHALFFQYYVKLKGMDQNLQAGEFNFYKNMHPADIIEVIKEGKVFRDQIKITIPEGLTAKQAAARLAHITKGSEEVYLEYFSSPAEFSYAFLQEMPAGLEYPLEGYLFPDTYYADAEAGEKEIVETLLKGFDRFYTQEVKERIAELGYSLHDVVTMASIVEREAILEEERPVIAGVFYNRLDIKMLLQSCATVQYALGEVKPKLLLEDLKIESPYNTYLNLGLPPGPIASPGKASLNAALYPDDTDYFYFVARDDGTGGHYFARNLAGHEQNKLKAKENRSS